MNQDRYKFRAWDIQNKRMISWNELLRNKELLQSFFGNEHYVTNPSRHFFEKMQCTGIKDLEDNLIYEGDIIRIMNKSPYIKKEYWFPEYIVTHDGWSFILEYKGGGESISCPEFNLKHRYQGKIIGNIYEHPTIN